MSDRKKEKTTTDNEKIVCLIHKTVKYTCAFICN
jgi:hypothetical protein